MASLDMAFRPSTAPRIPLPFGVRSAGWRRLAAGEGYSSNRIKRVLAMCWVVAGSGWCRHLRQLLPWRSGSLIVWPAGSVSAYQAGPEGLDIRWLTLDGGLAEEMVTAFGLIPPWPRHSPALAAAAIEPVMELLRQPNIEAEREATQAVWGLLLAAATGVSGLPQAESAVARLRAALEEGVGDAGFSVARAAAAMGVDRSVLSRGFRRAFGMPPQQWLAERRFARALDLLRRGGLGVAEVAGRCGFADPSYFARVFNLRTGESPTDFLDHIRRR